MVPRPHPHPLSPWHVNCTKRYTMIKLTRLNGSRLVLNALLIERVESTPDTVIRLTSGAQYVVRESADQVSELALEFLRNIRGGDGSAPAAQLGRTVR
jgi:flagellar protein FlbD